METIKNIRESGRREKNAAGMSRREFLKKASILGFTLPFAGEALALEKAISSVAERRSGNENGTEKPAIKLNFLYLRHTGPEDLKILKEKINEADLYIPEVFGWSDESLSCFQKISDGKMTPEEYMREIGADPRHPYYAIRLEELKTLYNRHKTIAMIDLKKGTAELGEYSSKTGSLTPYDTGWDFPEILAAYKSNMKIFADAQVMREKQIADNLKGLCGKIEADGISGTGNENEKRVLAVMGALHTGVSHELKRSGKDISRTFSPMPHLYNHSLETVRRCMFGKPLDDDTAARGLLETVISELARIKLKEKTHIDDRNKLDLLLSRLTDHLRASDIRGMFEKARAKGGGSSSSLGLYDELLNALSEKGVRIPESEEASDRMIMK